MAPGPGSLSRATPTLSSFTGNMNGTWNLYVVDDAGGDGGTIGGFSITFEVPFPTAVWTGGTFFTDAAATVPYVAGTETNTVYVKPTVTTPYTATIASGSCAGANVVTVTVLVAVAFEQPPVPVTVYVIIEEPAATGVIAPVLAFTVAAAVVAEVNDPPLSPLLVKVVEPFEQIASVPLSVPAFGAAVITTATALLVAVEQPEPDALTST